jgi:1-deoxy-D-xylulose-5-phosphate reductoisomerase
MVTRVTILGATGSVGRAVLDVMAENPGRFTLEAVIGGHDVAALADIARKGRARHAVIHDHASGGALREALSGSGISSGAGESAVIEAATREAEIVVSAITGTAGLAPTIAAIESGRVVALANKESLVAAGSILMRKARPGQLLPLDSEHNALSQALGQHSLDDVSEMILTASGGPFRTWSSERIRRATRADALAHPSWSMGAKITIDSASMMNKGLELIEAHHLFSIESKRLGVLVHPQSIIHGLVAFVDGSVTAGLAVADMKVPVAHCLGLGLGVGRNGESGHRLHAPSRRLDLAKMASLTFEAPDPVRFPALTLSRAAMEAGAAMPIVLNAANEVAVAAFLQDEISFGAITDLVDEMCSRFSARHMAAPRDLSDIMALDREVRSLSRAALSQPSFAVT